MDMISWDNYPEKNAEPASIALNHELMRGIKGGQPFMLMEQTPSVSNWLADNGLKRPGVMRLQSYQAVAHGADTIMFFQMRRSPAACEKFHGAIIDHSGRSDTRVFKECAHLGEELRELGDETLGTVTNAKAALIFDWDTWWAVEGSAGPTTRLRYVDEILNYYRAFFELNIPIDIIGSGDDLKKYEVVVAPLFYMVKPGVDQKLTEFAKEGGTLLFTYFSGYVNENDYITVGGYPGKLRELTGIWVEEIDALSKEERNSFLYKGEKYPAELLCDIIHTEGAETLSEYQEDFYKNTPVVTKNPYGRGKVYYIGTRSNKAFYSRIIEDICLEKGIPAALNGVPQEKYLKLDVEITERESNEFRYVFVLNHSKAEKIITMPQEGLELLAKRKYLPGQKMGIEPYGVKILKIRKQI